MGKQKLHAADPTSSYSFMQRFKRVAQARNRRDSLSAHPVATLGAKVWRNSIVTCSASVPIQHFQVHSFQYCDSQPRHHCHRAAHLSPASGGNRELIGAASTLL
jgi:hypothetical protein